MNLNNIDKGTKRKCTNCGTLFFDFNKTPLICPHCGSDVKMLTNISKRGRPPKILKERQNENTNEVIENNDLDIEGIEEDGESVVTEEVIDEDDENVENIIDIGKDREEN